MRTGHILIVDDEIKMRDLLTLALEREGHRATSARDGREALRLLGEDSFDLVLTDLRMPDLDGRALLAEVKSRWPSIPVIVITAHATLRDAVELIKQGAFDYVGKPFEIDELEIVVRNALALRRALGENERLREQLEAGRADGNELVGSSPRFRAVVDAASEAAGARANVLLTGESGTGKEVVARAIHFGGERRDGPFVVINCAAIPGDLLESELFGHVKGAFTGALAARTGRFAQADGGTLFLDEIGDMPLAMQAKILRVLQDRLVTPVGGTRTTAVDVRIVAATNRDLQAAMQSGQFRQDLYYRLNVLAIELPPLRERAADVPELAAHFVQALSRAMGRPAPRLAPDALRALSAYAWPGNVRELQNCIERALISTKGATLTAAELPGYVLATPPSPEAAPRETAAPALAPDFDLDVELERIERNLVLEALARTGGVQVSAARLLGIKERSLWHRIKKLGIKFEASAK